ncbi:hypothetical protein Pmani_036838 [Petrolisthes manimaculis]|uniref:Uncharacterized protein n=1 Tax=Petrolisthes manimaculis TaxID=1843537 RepID=A0AAE1NJC8_9EUCA|nr:hypothetical protein Pmani_036838 [Petrolisthes manimaculis]
MSLNSPSPPPQELSGARLSSQAPSSDGSISHAVAPTLPQLPSPPLSPVSVTPSTTSSSPVSVTPSTTSPSPTSPLHSLLYRCSFIFPCFTLLHYLSLTLTAHPLQPSYPH